MSYLDRISLLVQEWFVHHVVNGSPTVVSADVVAVVDDGDPEGGVRATVRLHLGDGFIDRTEPQDLTEWLTTKLQIWSYHEDRRPVVSIEGDTLLLTCPFIPNISQAEFVALALSLVPHKDDVIDIHFHGDHLEVTRVLNHNPTTMVKDQGNGECIRHHGEHIYITKHLLKTALGV